MAIDSPLVLLDNRPDIPDAGRFLLPVCTDKENLLQLLRALYHFQSQVGQFSPLPLYDIIQAIEYIGRPELAPCLAEYIQEVDCLSYPNTSPFIEFIPFDPFVDTGVPDGYVQAPFLVYDGGGAYPPAYQAGDIVVPNTAITLDPFDLFSGNLPSIKITVRGAGQIELDLLAMPLGGRAIIGINKPPNFTDILAGIFDSESETILELELDNSSFPNEDDIAVQHEINIFEASGVVTEVYITFYPVLDFDFSPLKFGGGIRKNGVQLCGFEEDAIVNGIESIRVNSTCTGFEKLLDGLWQPMPELDISCLLEPLQTQITDNGNDIDTNASNIASAVSQINTNTGNIASNASNISNLINITNDHETRITDLENAEPPATGSGGVYEEISTQLLQSNGQFTAVDVSGYRYWKATMLVASDQASEAWLNATISPVGTVNSTLLANSALVAIMSGATVASSGMYTQVIVECEGSCFERSKSLNSIYNKPSGGGNSPTFNGHNMQSWLNEPIDTINFTPNIGTLLAGSFLSIVGIPCDDGLDLPELPSGQERIIVSFDAGGYEQYTLNVNDGYPVIGAGEFGNGLHGYLNKATGEGATGIDIEMPSNNGITRIQFSLKTDFISDFSSFDWTNENYKISRLNSLGEQIELLVDNWQQSAGHGFEKRIYEPNPGTSSTHTIQISISFGTEPPSGAWGEFSSVIDSIAIDYLP